LPALPGEILIANEPRSVAVTDLPLDHDRLRVRQDKPILACLLDLTGDGKKHAGLPGEAGCVVYNTGMR